MLTREGVELAPLTTLGLGGPARRLVTAYDEDEVVRTVTTAGRSPLLVLGGGSNLVVGDDGVDGTVLQIATHGLSATGDGDEVLLTAAAGEDWDALVARAVGEGWVGLEALSGIPGSVGATPVQNVGAYGQEVADTIARVRVLDRAEGRVRTFFHGDCGFGYRTSRFKREPGRYVVLTVTFQLRLGDRAAPVRYAELARELGVELGERPPLSAVREAVLRLRSGKGMVLDDTDLDTWSAGSFFTNPVLDPDAVPEGAPAWPQPDGRVKTSAAWLIAQAGYGKGYAGPGGRVSVSTKHTLALTNRGQARTDDLLALAREVRSGVADRFGIVLENEPVLVGCRL